MSAVFRRSLAAAILGLAPLWSAETTTDPALRRILDAYQVENPPRAGLQRPVDPRLERIETKGIAGSGLFPGQIHRVRTAAELQALSGRLAPGDQVMLAAGTWADARFTLAGRGAADAPILIRGESRGAVVLTGQSAATFHGEHLVIMDLTFADVQVPAKGGVVLRLGNGADLPARNCLVNHVVITRCNSPRPEDWPRVRMFYVVERGWDNTIAHSEFSEMRHHGQMIAAQELPPEGWQRLHILHNRFSGRPKIDDQNGYEIIQLGWSGERAKATGSLIQDNVFEDCNGEGEIITLKGSDVFVRGNTFLGCQGALTLREAERVLVQGNVFDGRGVPNTGGVRVAGADHVIVENTFRRLSKPASYYYWTISLMAASAERAGDDVAGYGRARNVLIARNRFEQNDARLAVGIYPRPQYPLLPDRIRVLDNDFTGTSGASPFDYRAPGLPASAVEESGNRFR